jgi:hypothetical protein
VTLLGGTRLARTGPVINHESAAYTDIVRMNTAKLNHAAGFTDYDIGAFLTESAQTARVVTGGHSIQRTVSCTTFDPRTIRIGSILA